MRFVVSHNVFIIISSILCVTLFGCSSGQIATTEQDQLQQNEVPQNNSSTIQKKPAVNSKRNSTQQKPLSSVFTVQADTVEVQQGKKTVAVPMRQQIVNKNETKTIFSVQIGAFKSSANATSAESRLKNRFKEPTHSFFDEKLKMVRVFIGIFSTARLAENLLVKMKQEYPKDYSGSFVWELKK